MSTNGTTEQTEIVLLRQHVAVLVARCQAVTAEKERYRVQVEERYGAVAQWQAEAETNRQAWLKAQEAEATLRATLGRVVFKMRDTAAVARRSNGTPNREVVCDTIDGWADELEQVLGAAPREGQA